MSCNQFSCCYYPTRVLFVDDDASFLKIAKVSLSAHQKVVQFLSPFEAADFLKEQLAKQSEANKWIYPYGQFDLDDDDIEPHTTLNLNTFNIHKAIYNPDRFDDVSVMVVDYTMPKQNGVEFCRQFKGSPVKKILITGNATLEVAINAFNEGIIDKFVVKEDSAAFLEKLNKEVVDLQEAYFRDMSKMAMEQFTAIEGSPFKDAKFCEQYRELLQGVELKEYYMIDQNGSLLILDETAKPSWLFVKTDTNLNEHHMYAEESEDCPKKIISALKQKEHMVYFFSSQDHTVPTEGWGKYMHKAEVLKGEYGDYYYTHVESPSIYEQSLEKDKIVSFNEYFSEKEDSWD